MTWQDFLALLKRPWSEQQLAVNVADRFHLRSLLEVVRKREEFILKLNEVAKHDTAEHLKLAEKYHHYLETLDWLLDAHL